MDHEFNPDFLGGVGGYESGMGDIGDEDLFMGVNGVKACFLVSLEAVIERDWTFRV